MNTLLQDPGVSSGSKTEVQNQSDSPREFRAVASKCHLPILSTDLDGAICHR